MQIDKLFAGKFRRGGREHEIADVRERFALAHAHVNLAGRRVHAHGFGFGEKIRGNGARVEHRFDGVANVCVREHGAARDFDAFAETHIAHAHAAHCGNAVGARFREDFFRETGAADIDAVFLELVGHFLNEQIRSPLENKHAAAHEVGKHDAVSDCGFVKRGAVRVGNRFEQQTPHIGASGKKFFEQLASRARVAVVVVHLRKMFEKRADALCGNAKLLDENAREVFAVKRRAHVEFRVDETNVFELSNGIGDFFRPIFSAGLNHAVREPVKRNIKNVSARTLEIRCKPAELIMVLEQQHGKSRLRKVICAGEPGKPGADDDGVVKFPDSVERIVRAHFLKIVNCPGRKTPILTFPHARRKRKRSRGAVLLRKSFLTFGFFEAKCCLTSEAEELSRFNLKILPPHSLRFLTHPCRKNYERIKKYLLLTPQNRSWHDCSYRISCRLFGNSDSGLQSKGSRRNLPRFGSVYGDV